MPKVTITHTKTLSTIKVNGVLLSSTYTHTHKIVVESPAIFSPKEESNEVLVLQ